MQLCAPRTFTCLLLCLEEIMYFKLTLLIVLDFRFVVVISDSAVVVSAPSGAVYFLSRAAYFF